jgi:hypothetical protein
MDQINNNPKIQFYSTYFYDGSDSPTYVTKELSLWLVKDTIRGFIGDQFKYIYGARPDPRQLEMLVDGFMLFNLHKNKSMLMNRNTLNQYLNNKHISIEETSYFLNIVLQIQKPHFISQDEMEYIRATGTVDGYGDYSRDDSDDSDTDESNNIDILFDNLEKTIGQLSSKISKNIYTPCV